MKVIKRDGRKVDYDSDKIVIAISKANKEVGGKDKISRESIDFITRYIESLNKPTMSVEDIQDIIERKLMEFGKFTLAKKYILYRDKHAMIRQANSTDENIMVIIKNNYKESAEENSNQNTYIAINQRNLIAGEISRDLTDRVLLPDRIAKASNDGVFYFHDKDYFIQAINNCCYVNIGDMLDNGTVINNKMIESPKSFHVACIVVSQIIASVASNQCGGVSVNICHLGKYLRKSYDKVYNQKIMYYVEKGYTLDEADARAREDSEEKMREELASGVQSIHYQINTLMTTSGKVPYVTFFMHIEEKDKFKKENALIIEEFFKQNFIGMKDENGNDTTPEFPKMVYVLDDNNCLKGGEYDYLTELAIKCTLKRNNPFYLSSKKMKEKYDGNVFCPMGYNSFLIPWKDKKGKYKFEGRFNQGVVTVNLPQIGIITNGDEDKFWKLFNDRLEICKDAIMCKYNALLDTRSEVSPIHWQYGAISRLKKGEKINDLLNGNYSTISLGFCGLYELTKLVKGCSFSDSKGMEFANKVILFMKDKVESWRNETGIGFILYATCDDRICKNLLKIDKERFGDIAYVTDKDQYTNSFWINDNEKLSNVEKLSIEAKFQDLIDGGAISYICNPENEKEIREIVKFANKEIMYLEFRK